MRLSDDLQHSEDVIHVVEIDDRVIDCAEDLHGVALEDLAVPKVGHALDVLEAGKHLLDVTICLEESVTRNHTAGCMPLH